MSKATTAQKEIPAVTGHWRLWNSRWATPPACRSTQAVADRPSIIWSAAPISGCRIDAPVSGAIRTYAHVEGHDDVGKGGMTDEATNKQGEVMVVSRAAPGDDRGATIVGARCLRRACIRSGW
eukprot:GHVU01103407.1.p2 GENE.GHVU01103407.1~~GHVU01103407.1.p2  ORF type:complete len:123 (-),score=11.40 GHVU01103407.1:5-373(-)